MPWGTTPPLGDTVKAAGLLFVGVDGVETVGLR
jgi:hypothetical protein